MIVKRSGTWWLAGAVAATFLILLACGDGGGGGETAQREGCGSPPGEVDVEVTSDVLTREQILEKDPSVTKRGVVRWGWMFELSGTLAAFGQPTGDGILMAVEEINEDGGFQVGDTIYTIELVRPGDGGDTRTDISQTVALATELVRDRGVCVIWGPASTGEPEATQITQRRRVLHLCACEGRELTALQSEEQAQDESKWAFQTLPPITALFREGPADLKEDFPNLETFAILCRNDDTGRRVCPVLTAAYEEAGFELVIDPSEVEVSPETTDFRTVLTKIKAADPDIFLNFVDPFNQGTLLKQALELDIGEYYGAVVQPPNVWDIAIGHPGIHEKYVGWGGFPRQQIEPTSEEAAAYFERYTEFKGGELPLVPFVSLLTYDYVYMLVAAMQQAGTVEDTTAIAEALEQVHYDGVGEDDIYFNSRHIGVMGGDGCTIHQRQATCEHAPPPAAIQE